MHTVFGAPNHFIDRVPSNFTNVEERTKCGGKGIIAFQILLRSNLITFDIQNA